MTPIQTSVFAGGVIAALASLSIGWGPSALSPYPLLVLWPAFSIGRSAALFAALLFWAWAPRLFLGDGRIPARSAVALGVLTALTPVWFILGWKFGIRFDGWVHTVGMAVLNIVLPSVAWVLLVRGRKASSFTGSVRFHVALFGWLAWAAFPNLGELP